jgi:hypothetical protein
LGRRRAGVVNHFADALDPAPAFSQQMMPLAFVGLHALARRYERGAARDDLQ